MSNKKANRKLVGRSKRPAHTQDDYIIGGSKMEVERCKELIKSIDENLDYIHIYAKEGLLYGYYTVEGCKNFINVEENLLKEIVACVVGPETPKVDIYVVMDELKITYPFPMAV